MLRTKTIGCMFTSSIDTQLQSIWNVRTQKVQYDPCNYRESSALSIVCRYSSQALYLITSLQWCIRIMSLYLPGNARTSLHLMHLLCISVHHAEHVVQVEDE